MSRDPLLSGGVRDVSPRRDAGRRGPSRLSRFTAVVLLALLAACSGSGGDPVPPELSINIPTANLEIGGNVQLAALQARGTVSWSSSNTAVATVVSTGFVTAVGPGSATITASTPTQSASSTVTVLAPPAISLAVSSATFSAQAGGAGPTPTSVLVSNGGPGTLQNLSVSSVTYGAGQPAGWLVATLSATSATAAQPAALQLVPSTVGLAAGIYTATVSVSASPASNSPRTLTVTLTVTPPPTIQLSAASAAFTSIVGGAAPAAQVITVSAGDGGVISALTRSIRFGQPAQAGWLTATLNATTTPASLTLQALPGSLPTGTYTATVSILSPNASNSPQTIAVSYEVTEQPRLVVSQSAISFAAPFGGPNPAAQEVLVSNAGGGGARPFQMEVVYGGSDAFLEFFNTVLTTPSTLRFRPNVVGLAAGQYSATIRVTDAGASNGTQTIAVSVTVGDSPTLALSRSTVNFEATVASASPAPVQISLTNSTPAVVTGLSTTVEYGSGSGWLNVSLSGGNTPSTLTLSPVIASLAVGTYTANVRVASQNAVNSPQTVVVTLTVAARPAIAVSTTPYSFSGTTVTSPPAQLRTVDNGGGGTLSGLGVTVQYTGTSGWLIASLDQTTAPATLTVQALSGGLAAGTYNATVRLAALSATNTPVLIPVVFTLGASPKIGLSATSRSIAVGQGNNNAALSAVTVSNVGVGTLSGLSASITYLGGPENGWLTATLSGATAPATLSLVTNAGSPAAKRDTGVYTARVRITSSAADNTPQDVIVSFDVGLSLANSAVYSTLSPSCTGCHNGGASPNFNSASTFYSVMVNAAVSNPRGSGTDPLVNTYPTRVVPYSAATSYVWHEISWSAGAYGMPTGAKIPQQSTIDLFRDWINDGAHR